MQLDLLKVLSRLFGRSASACVRVKQVARSSPLGSTEQSNKKAPATRWRLFLGRVNAFAIANLNSTPPGKLPGEVQGQKFRQPDV